MKQKNLFLFATVIFLLLLTCCTTENDQMFFASRPEGMESEIYSNKDFEMAGNGEFYAVLRSETGSHYVLRYKNDGDTHTYNYILLGHKQSGSRGHEVYEFTWKNDQFFYDSYTQILSGRGISEPLVLHFNRHCHFPDQMDPIWIMDHLNESFNVYDYDNKR